MARSSRQQQADLRAAAPSAASAPQLSGRVVWTGSSSLDIRIELEQGGQQQLTALFTFVARDALTGRPYRINSVQPQTAEVGEGWEWEAGGVAALSCPCLRSRCLPQPGAALPLRPALPAHPALPSPAPTGPRAL